MQVGKEVKDKNVEYMTQEIEHIITSFGDRDSGSEGERNALDYMAGDLKNYADTVEQESFNVHPESFYGWMPITGTFMLLATISIFFLPILSLIFIGLAILPMLSQFVF